MNVFLLPPRPIVEVQGEVLVENSLARLICTVPRSKPPAQIRWFRGKKEIAGVSSRHQTGKIFAITSSVNFTVDRKDNGDIVTCEANVPSVKGMKNRTDFPLNVRFPPVVKVQTPSVHLREGDDLTLTCLVTGNPQ
ncbi:cell adhesion molecule 4-like [Rhincodon typus]|uniref:cell adhesion molecule 4-like n=1 Tax=Rhincodon typus TaxID=259920 RepID=UPI00202EF97D|nr:cell adhesion molecule 4-like [Rhincodon typus]